MPQDAQGLTLTVASQDSARAYDHVVEGFLKYRFDTGQRLKTFITADPLAPLGQVMAGAFAMLAYDRQMLARAETSLARAEALHASPRERAHIAALRAWIDGHPEQALAIWEQAPPEMRAWARQSWRDAAPQVRKQYDADALKWGRPDALEETRLTPRVRG